MFEIEDEDWEAVKAQVKEELIKAARRGKPIYYSDIINRVSGFDGPHSHALAWMLGQISEESWKAEGLLLSAMAYLKYEHVPGTGFYAVAEKLPSFV